MSQTTSAPPTSPSLAIRVSDGFGDWLLEQNISFSFTTYQTNRLFCVGVNPQGRFALQERLFDKPMGLFAQGERLYMSSRYQIWEFANLLAPGETRHGCDRLYYPKQAHTTGDLNVHDLILTATNELIFVNTDFSCLSRLSPNYSFEPIWQPPFISRLAAEDRCHFNGLAQRDGRPAYISACSTTDEAAGWRNHRIAGGVVVDIQANQMIAHGLSMPHSPRWYGGKLWLLNSGTGELGHIDLQTGKFCPLVFCSGFVRGLAFWQQFALVGLSKLRARPFSGLALEDRLNALNQTAQCGLVIIDLSKGEIIHSLYLDTVVEELFDVVVLPGVRQPQVLGFQSEDIERLVTFPGSGGIVTTKPTVKRPSQSQMPPVAGLPRQLWEENQEAQTAEASVEPIPIPAGELKFQRVFHLNAESLLPYDAFTYPSLQQRWLSQPQTGSLCGISATFSGEMIGFAIAEFMPTGTAELISLFVAPEYRQQQVATRMVAQLERSLIAEEATEVWVTYHPTPLTHLGLEPLLATLGWQPPTPLANGDQRASKRLTETVPVTVPETTPEPIPAASNLANAARDPFEQGKRLARAGDFAAAIPWFEQALQIEPTYLAAYNQLGNALQNLGRLPEAIAAYQRLLQINPNVAPAHCNLGAVWQLQGQLDQAIAAYQRAIQLQPDFALAYLNLGRLYSHQKAWQPAEQAIRVALQLQPNSAEAYVDLATVLRQTGETRKAIACCIAALKVDSNQVSAWHNLGCLWMTFGEMGKAQECLERVLQLEPEHQQAHSNLGQVLQAQGQLFQSLEHYNRALELDPAATDIFYQREHLRISLCDWQDYPQRMQTLQAMLQIHFQTPDARTLLPLSINNFPLPLTCHRDVSRLWTKRVTDSVQSIKTNLTFPAPSPPAPKLRLGYISGDFREHAVGTLIYDLFQYHDRSKFEVYAYSLGRSQDAYTEKIRTDCDSFVDLSTLATAAAAQRIHSDGIHILIDLTGYTTFSRAEILALQPAPIQIQYLGYPGTMAAPFMPYILADRWLIPAELTQYYSEKILEVPHALFTSPLTIAEHPASRAEVGLPAKGFVFCCFNRCDKFEPKVFASWMRILQQVPGSVLWLIETLPEVSQTLRQAAQEWGVDPVRLIFSPRRPLEEYLASYRLADLFLDTFVYNAGATAMHALAVGLPVLTCPGQAYVARMGASICAAAGLEGLICENPTAYEQQAIHLATHANELKALRRQLQKQHDTLPLFRPQDWVAQLESVLGQLWEEQGS